jgi:hypothetical protein
VFVIVTLALGTAEPLASRMVPPMLPEMSCAQSCAHKAKTHSVNSETFFIPLHFSRLIAIREIRYKPESQPDYCKIETRFPVFVIEL